MLALNKTSQIIIIIILLYNYKAGKYVIVMVSTGRQNEVNNNNTKSRVSLIRKELDTGLIKTLALSRQGVFS